MDPARDERDTSKSILKSVGWNKLALLYFRPLCLEHFNVQRLEGNGVSVPHDSTTSIPSAWTAPASACGDIIDTKHLCNNVCDCSQGLTSRSLTKIRGLSCLISELTQYVLISFLIITSNAEKPHSILGDPTTYDEVSQIRTLRWSLELEIVLLGFIIDEMRKYLPPIYIWLLPPNGITLKINSAPLWFGFFLPSFQQSRRVYKGARISPPWFSEWTGQGMIPQHLQQAWC